MRTRTVRFDASGTSLLVSLGDMAGPEGWNVIVQPSSDWVGSIVFRQDVNSPGGPVSLRDVAYQRATGATEVAAGTPVTAAGNYIVSQPWYDLWVAYTHTAGSVNLVVYPATQGVPFRELSTAFTAAGFQMAGQQTTDAMLAVSVAMLLSQQIDVRTFGAVGDDATDDTAAIQAAIDAAGAGGCLIFPEGIYRCVGLTSSANAQRWIGYGQVILKKNGNGVILTHSGNDFYAENIQWRGESATPTYTGDNLNLTGANPKLVMCGSRYAYARAVLATGNHVQILGTNDIYQTADATATGYDIEIGVSGTATLYHQLHGIYSSQSTGGIKFIDCGSQSVVGGQFGKYTVAAGTSPAGVNGGNVQGARILGPVTIDISSSILVGCQFGASATITYGAGTSGHEYWGNVDSNGAITNNGNKSAAIVRQVGSDGTVQLQYGDDTSTAIMKANPNGGLFTFPQIEIPNNVNYRVMRASPNQTSLAGRFGATASDNVALTAEVGSLQYGVPTGQAHQWLVNAAEVAGVNASGIRVGVAAGSQSSGVVAFGNGTQTTVGAAGAASALPATPSGYLRFYIGSTQYVIPYYAQA